MTELSSRLARFSPVAKAEVVTIIARSLAGTIAAEGKRALVAEAAVDLCVAWVEGRLDEPARLSFSEEVFLGRVYDLGLCADADIARD